MTDVLEPLAKSPRLPLYLAELQRLVETEHQRRQRFYDEMTESQKAEFINGEIIVHSPAKYRHTIVVGNIHNLCNAFVRRHDLGFVGGEKMLITLPRNDYEPDVCFFRREIAGQFTPEQMHFPAPDLIVEVLSESTEARDRGVKFEDYADNGVREYWLVDPDRAHVEQYLLQSGRFDLHFKADTGEIKCAAIPGLVISVKAIFDPTANQAALKAILSE
jgi:Uma2 family endonuclease